MFAKKWCWRNRDREMPLIFVFTIRRTSNGTLRRVFDDGYLETVRMWYEGCSTTRNLVIVASPTNLLLLLLLQQEKSSIFIKLKWRIFFRWHWLESNHLLTITDKQMQRILLECPRWHEARIHTRVECFDFLCNRVQHSVAAQKL